MYPKDFSQALSVYKVGQTDNTTAKEILSVSKIPKRGTRDKTASNRLYSLAGEGGASPEEVAACRQKKKATRPGEEKLSGRGKGVRD